MYINPADNNQAPLVACMPLKDEAAVLSPDFRFIFLQWREWADEGGLPDWSKFDPINHPKLLTHVMLVEFDSSRVEDIRIILMGEHVREHFGPCPKGTLCRDIMPKGNFTALVDANRFCAINAKAVYFIKTMHWNNRDLLRYELLKLPFLKSNGLVTVVCLLRFKLEPGSASLMNLGNSSVRPKDVP